MKVIISIINEKNLYLVSANNLRDIANTHKVKSMKKNQRKSRLLYLINNTNQKVFENKEAFLENVKVLVLKNKITDKLSDNPRKIEKYLKYINLNLSDPNYIAMEMDIEQYIQVRLNALSRGIANIEFDIDEKIEEITNPISNNEILLISTKENKVYLPYTIDELEEYARRYPADYPTLKTVVDQEYMLPLNLFFEKPAQARFLETYYLIRKRENRNIIIALIFSIKSMLKKELNPAVIAACKTKQELLDYIRCLKEDKLDEFGYFKIVYDDYKISA